MGRKEAKIEDYLSEQVHDQGGFTRKVVYQGRTGSPDRWCFFPRGRLLIVETKAPDGKVPRPDQIQEMKMLRSLGHYVAWVQTREEVDEVLLAFHTLTLRKFNEAFPLAR